MATNNFDPPTGETPLSGDPNSFQWGQGQWQGAGGGETAAKYYAWKDFAAQFGRNPTQSELNQLAPSYLSSDPNMANTSGGKANVSAYYSQLSQSPTNIYNQQQGQLAKDAPKFAPQVDQLFQSNLGRVATDAEKTHFGMLLASGQDPYQIQQALQQTTEYSTKQTQQFTDQLKPQLQSSNADYFSKYILPSIQSKNAEAGRTQDSSGYQAQLANAAQGQNYDLQNYLAQIQAGGFQTSQANATNNYQQLLGQQYGLQNAGVSNQLANNAANQQYNQNLNMYQRQQQAYSNYLNQYGKRSGLSSGLQGALSGGVSGALAGSKFGAHGALLGGLGGAGLGGASGAYL